MTTSYPEPDGNSSLPETPIPSAEVEHHYRAAHHAITEPMRFMALSLYYVTRWLPQIGENGHRIVTVLRSLGYYDRKKDIQRGGVEIEQAELAAMCGMSLRTLQREFGSRSDSTPVNPALHLFVQRMKQYHQDSAGRIIRETTIYMVAMDDPIHPSDDAAYQAELAARQKAPSRTRQNDGNRASRTRQNDRYARQNDVPPRQNDVPARQNGGCFNKESITLMTLETPETMPPGVLPAAVSERTSEKTPEQQAVGKAGAAKLKAALEAARKATP